MYLAMDRGDVMLDFEFVASTKFAFGRGYHKNTGAYAAEYGKKALIHFDGGKFALESGLIDRVEESLKANGIETFHLGGVQPQGMQIQALGTRHIPFASQTQLTGQLCRHMGNGI